MELKEAENKESWTHGDYLVKLGKNGSVRSDVYHIYKSGKYVAQKVSLEGCKDWIADDIEKGSK